MTMIVTKFKLYCATPEHLIWYYNLILKLHKCFTILYSYLTLRAYGNLPKKRAKGLTVLWWVEINRFNYSYTLMNTYSLKKTAVSPNRPVELFPNIPCKFSTSHSYFSLSYQFFRTKDKNLRGGPSNLNSMWDSDSHKSLSRLICSTQPNALLQTEAPELNSKTKYFSGARTYSASISQFYLGNCTALNTYRDLIGIQKYRQLPRLREWGLPQNVFSNKTPL